MRILILSDGRPGHYRQSEAIAAAVGRFRPVDVARMELRVPRAIPRALVPRLARLLPPRAYLRLVHGLDADCFPPADLVLSAGALTFGANIALRRLRGTPNVIAGSLRGLDPEHVSLTLLPYERARTLPNHAYLLKPAAIDPDKLPRPRHWPGLNAASGLCLGVLIGGTSRTATFERADWNRLALLLSDLAAEKKLTIKIATSPRTPEDAYQALEGVARLPGVKFIDYRIAGAGTADEIFRADVILVTVDSMSMISEAVAAQRPTVALSPVKTQDWRDTEIITSLSQQDFLRILPLDGAEPLPTLDLFLKTIKPMTENHLDKLGRTVLDKTGL